jgi:site-specific recombinase XerD
MDPNDFDRRLERLNNIVKRARIDGHSKQLIFKYQEACFADGLSKARAYFYTNLIYIVAKMLGKPLNQAAKEDLIRVLSEIEKSDYKDWTKQGFKVALKKFYKWLRGTPNYPEEVSWIKTSIRKNKHLLPEQLLTADDVQRMVDAAKNPRDKALITTLYDTGIRIGELLKLTIGHVTFDRYGVQLIVNGKTGMRRVRGVLCTAALRRWLEEHPKRKRPNAPLWIDRYGNPMTYEEARMAIRKVAQRAGITKPINPHSFRHSRATWLANKLTEAQMKEHFGWTQSSDMASIYVHLAGRDVDKALLKAYGVVMEEEKEEKVELTRICPRCGEVAAASAKFCPRCSLALDVEAIIQVEEARKVGDQIMEELIQDPEVLSSPHQEAGGERPRRKTT